MIVFLLALILIMLCVIANALRVMNDNMIHFGRNAKADATSQVLLLRGIKAVAIQQTDNKLNTARNG